MPKFYIQKQFSFYVSVRYLTNYNLRVNVLGCTTLYEI